MIKDRHLPFLKEFLCLWCKAPFPRRGWLLLVVISFSLFGCFSPEEMSLEQRKEVFSNQLLPFYKTQPQIKTKLTFAEAIARALKYNLDLSKTHIESNMAWLDHLEKIHNYWPKVSLKRTENYRKKPSQRLEYNPLEKFYEINRVKNYSRTWNNSITASLDVLDLAQNYLSTRITSNQFLIANQKEKEAIWRTIREVTLNYFPAAMAIKLKPEMEKIRLDTEEALHSLRARTVQNDIPLESLKLERDLLQVKNVVNKKYTEFLGSFEKLSQIMAMDPNLKYSLEHNNNYIPLSLVDPTQMDRNAFMNRPELFITTLEARVSKDKVRKELLSLLPSLSVSKVFTYSGDKTYINNKWNTTSFSLSWDIVRLASLNSLLKKQDVVEVIGRTRQNLVALSLLLSNRLAVINYVYNLDRYTSALETSFLEKKFLSSILADNQGDFSTKTKLDRLEAELNYLTALMDQSQAYASLQASALELLRAQGMMIIPAGFNKLPLKDLTYRLKTTIEFNNYVTPITRDTKPTEKLKKSPLWKTVLSIQDVWKKDPDYKTPNLTKGATILSVAGALPYKEPKSAPQLKSSALPEKQTTTTSQTTKTTKTTPLMISLPKNNPLDTGKKKKILVHLKTYEKRNTVLQ